MTAACVRCGFDPSVVVRESWMFVLDRELKSVNSRIVNSIAAGHAYRKDRDAWAWEIRAQRLKLKIPRALQLRRMVITRLYSGRQREWDHDNFGAKQLVDAIVREGLLLGDDPSHLEATYRQERAAKSGVRVLIEELARPA